MGYKASCILIDHGHEPGCFGRSLQHDPQRAESVIRQLGYNAYRPVSMTRVDEGIYPKGSEIYVGAYPGCTFLAHADITDGFLNPPGATTDRSERERLLAMYPNARLIVMLLHSVVNLWGYAVVERGEIVRARAAAATTGPGLSPANRSPRRWVKPIASPTVYGVVIEGFGPPPATWTMKIPKRTTPWEIISCSPWRRA